MNMVPTLELLGGAGIVAGIEHLQERRSCEVPFANVEIEIFKGCELVSGERNYDVFPDCRPCSCFVLNERSARLVFRPDKTLMHFRSSVSIADGPNPADVPVGLELIPL